MSKVIPDTEILRKRVKTISLWQKGVSRHDIATQINVTKRSVDRWIKSFEENGISALLTVKKASTAQSKLTRLQIEQLRKILVNGSVLYGYPDERWTLIRVRAVILTEFNVTYRTTYIKKILKRNNFDIVIVLEADLMPQLMEIAKNKKPVEYGIDATTWTAPLLSKLADRLYGHKYSPSWIYEYFHLHNLYFANQDTAT